jgi:NADH-quinone oxidoreductase subunit A
VKIITGQILFAYHKQRAYQRSRAGEIRLLQNYLPVFIFILIGIAIGLVAPTLGYLLGPKRPDPEKLSTYECGFPAFNDAHAPFDVRYYLVAILFIIFDLETAFLVPWAVVFRQLGWLGMIAMGVFLGLLTIGFVYEWMKGALEWE